MVVLARSLTANLSPRAGAKYVSTPDDVKKAFKAEFVGQNKNGVVTERLRAPPYVWLVSRLVLLTSRAE